jgi:hypothetical protein
MTGLNFDAKCPVCDGYMANNNKYCSLRCYNKSKIQEVIEEAKEQEIKDKLKVLLE